MALVWECARDMDRVEKVNRRAYLINISNCSLIICCSIDVKKVSMMLTLRPVHLRTSMSTSE